GELAQRPEVRLGEDVHVRAGLHAGRRRGHVRVEAYPRIVRGGQRDLDPAQLGEARRRGEPRVEAAGRHRERRRGPEVEPYREVAGEGEGGQPRVVDRRVDGQLAGVDVEQAEDVDVQQQHPGVLGGQGDG